MGNKSLHECARCRRTLPLLEFGLDRGGVPLSWCKQCVTKYRAERRAREKVLHGVDPEFWDWAAMLCKSVKATASVRQEPVDEQTFDAEALRCIMLLQQRQCAVSTMDLLVPAKTITRGLGMAKWRGTLTDKQRAISVDAIRIDKQSAWMTGNVVLVGHIYACMYDLVPDLASFRDWCTKLTGVKTVVYDNSAISRLREVRCKKRLEGVTDD